ncbi:hypothetical protein HN51_028400 [Arachis hypogaea]|uniref:F-box domain-containing protein n=1 Tax=Arachis hypogaea TaxID=3818 RepID=A0A445BJ00_ARAHY|nr:F-box/LRR-repeat protein 13 isoform X1 [Arachis hypogaea]XP_025619411.1 F-box/LRR-repeat protein 13 isoform X1 [Arachis hypogaea]XP_057735636.1 F-box/LRR-repeat protein 13-like isoform X1 [Arachis stenosperma]QHO34886.1 F-box/LRR-repeat protein [Arachis hypogaea]RYR38662.1 hypothetical protein Ahy_A09g043793 [Arachis hypogaea]
MRIITRSQSRKKIGRYNQNQNESEGDGGDRISDLPDSILLHIMSFMMIHDVIKTCILSTRWKNLWKSMPNIKLHTADFRNHCVFSEFISGIVSCRDGRGDGDHPLISLDFSRHGYLQNYILTDLMRYVVSKDIQHLKIYVPYNLGLPSFVFSCSSLLSLDLSVSSYDLKRRTRISKPLELPSLVSLRLESVAISVDENCQAEPFSKCVKLKTLSINNFLMISPDSDIDRSGTLVISNAKLANLTIKEYKRYKILVSTPNLRSFTLDGSPFQQLRGKKGMAIELQSSSLA